jgi:hypothetical protein
MTSTTQIPQPLDAASGLAPLRAKRGWIVALGIVYLIAGLIALGSIVMATIVSVFVVGIMMLIAGVAEVFHAFQYHPSSRPHYPGALAGLQPLYLRAVSRYRSRLCRRRLDSRRFWSGKARVGLGLRSRLSFAAHA